MFYLDAHYLSRCQVLSELGLAFDMGVGSLVARGYADLGIEVFVVLPGEKIRSLFTGEHSSFSENRFFFGVPDVEALFEAVDRSYGDILQLEYEERRIWRLSISYRGETFTSESSKLTLALIENLIAWKESQNEGAT